VKNENTWTKANGADSFLYYIDTELRTFGERRGLDTLVVQNVNDKSSRWVSCLSANAVSSSPENYKLVET